MVLKEEVTRAFATLGITPDTDQSDAARAYKKLALKYHPDKNTTENTTAKFQEVGSAWHVCQRHYEHPELSQKHDFGSSPFGAGGSPFGRGGPMFYSPGMGFFSFGGGPPPGFGHSHSHSHSHSHAYDDEEESDDEYEEDEGGYSRGYDEDDAAEDFFRFMFEEVLRGKYSYDSGQAYRKRQPQSHSSQSRSSFPQFTSSQRDSGYGGSGGEYSQNAQNKEKREYEERLKEFEREIREEEAREKEEAAKKEKSAQALREARNKAFEAARRGDGEELKRVVELFDLDVNAPRSQKANESKGFETILHLVSASSQTSVPTLVWLTSERNANPSALNSFGLSPFHVAVLKGNIDTVKWYVGLSPVDNGAKVKNKEGCHPGKVLSKDSSKTPLDLAMESGNVQMVELMVKYATVHKVANVWSKLNLGEDEEKEVRKVLLTKNGFVPPDEKKEDTTLSKKELERLEKLERIKIQEENKARKEERRRQAKLREEEEAETRRAIELVEQQQREEREREERLKQMKIDQENRRKQEEADRHRKEAEEKRKAEDVRQRKVEAERQKAETERKKAETERQRVETEKKRIWKEEQDKLRRAEVEADTRRREQENVRLENERLKSEAKERADASRLEQERVRKELEAKIRAEVEAELRTESKSKPAIAPSSGTPASAKQGDKPRKVCRSYKKGYCKFKDRCRDLHVRPEPTVEEQIRSQQATPEPPATTALPSKQSSHSFRASHVSSPTPAILSTPATASVDGTSTPDDASTIASAKQKGKKVCSFYAKGKYCMFGHRCRNLHIRDEALNGPSSKGSEDAQSSTGHVNGMTNGVDATPSAPAPKKRTPKKKTPSVSADPTLGAPSFTSAQTIPTFEYAATMPEFEHYQTMPAYGSYAPFEDFQTMPNVEDELFPIQRKAQRPPALAPTSTRPPHVQHLTKEAPPHLNGGETNGGAPKQKYFQRRTPGYRKPNGGSPAQ